MTTSLYSNPAIEDFIVNKVKALFTSAVLQGETPEFRRIGTNLQQVPEPTRETVGKPNSAVIVGLRDEFFAIPLHSTLFGATRSLWNSGIIVYDYDDFYGDRADFVRERFMLKAWPAACGKVPTRLDLVRQLPVIMLTLKRGGALPLTSDNIRVQTLLELMADFYHFENTPTRKRVFDYIWGRGILLYMRSTVVRYFVDWVLDRLRAATWTPRRFERPWPKWWKEWGVYGRYGGKADPLPV